MMRMSGRGEDGKAKALKVTNRGTLITEIDTRERVIIPLEFDGERKKQLISRERVSTDRVYSSHLKKIEVYIIIHAGKRPSPEIAVRVSGTVNNILTNFSAYDWNTEKWMVSSISSAGNVSGQMYASLVATQPTQGFLLSTHPQFYWLKNFAGDSFQLQFSVLEDFDASDNIEVEAYLVGDPV